MPLPAFTVQNTTATSNNCSFYSCKHNDVYSISDSWYSKPTEKGTAFTKQQELCSFLQWISKLTFLCINKMTMIIYIWVGCPRLSRMLLQPRDDGTDGTAGAWWVVLGRRRPCRKLGSVSCKPRRLFAAQWHNKYISLFRHKRQPQSVTQENEHKNTKKHTIKPNYNKLKQFTTHYYPKKLVLKRNANCLSWYKLCISQTSRKCFMSLTVSLSQQLKILQITLFIKLFSIEVTVLFGSVTSRA